jgi:hypothetical protein
VAVDLKSGQKAWDIVSCDKAGQVGQTGAPRVGGGKIFMGNACMDTGESRGFVRCRPAGVRRVMRSARPSIMGQTLQWISMMPCLLPWRTWSSQSGEAQTPRVARHAS